MISVVVVNWNSGRFLEKCVVSLCNHAAECEMIVVDNASDDGSADFIASSDPGLIFIQNAENAGFAAANNAGWRRSRGDPILFLNPDVECTRDAIGQLERAILQETAFWACAGRLLPAAGARQTHDYVRRLPTVSSVAAEMLLLDEIWPGNPWTRRYRMTGEDFGRIREVEQPAAACLMVRRSALECISGFDERFSPAWFEDVDLCKRIRDAGGKILLQPAARFFHHGGYSLNRLSYGKFLEHYHTNQIRYFAKNYGRRESRRVRGFVIAGMHLRAGISIFRSLLKGSTRAESFRVFRTAARHFSTPSEGTT